MNKNDMAHQTAQIILQAEAFRLTPKTPIRLVSGLYSPFYIDCRRLISHAEGRMKIGDFLANLILENIGTEKCDVIAGGVTAGVPFATMVADRLKMPMVYVRPEPKAHGKGQQIEGGDVAGKHVILVEDLITNAGSKIRFADALRKEKAHISDTIVVFDRSNEEGRQTLSETGLQLHALSNFDDLLAVLEESPDYTSEDINHAKAFLAAPEEWSAAHAPSDSS